MGKTPLKKVIKSKLKTHKELTNDEILREKIKYEIAEELGLSSKVDELGWVIKELSSRYIYFWFLRKRNTSCSFSIFGR